MIKVAICGYGNLGRGVEKVVATNDDMQLVGIFTRREADGKLKSVNDILHYSDKIDVLLMCGGSATDLPLQSPKMAESFCIVDSFDTHAKILEHKRNVEKAALKNKKTAVISCGWDPGLFSLARLLFSSYLPNATVHSFWGNGVSQGHSDAIRRVEGVLDAVQYTVPNEQLIQKASRGEKIDEKNKHKRVCFVVVKENADKSKVESQIKNMENYFLGYHTEVNFVSLQTLKKEHSTLPHGGRVIAYGKTSDENSHSAQLKIVLDSNPEFTASIMLAYARAAYRLNKENKFGCFTPFDIAPKYLHKEAEEALIKNLC